MASENYELIKLDGQWYYFGCKLTNPDGWEVPLSFNNMITFEVTDNVLNWGHRGRFIYNSGMNVFERKPNPYEEPIPEKKEEDYVFRNDKRDTLLIHIEPAVIGDEPPFPDCYVFDMEFVVTYRYNLPSNDIDRQFTVLELEEMDIQQMFERSIEWSTATAQLNPFHGKEQTRMHDDEREMQTGLAIKDLLNVTERKWDGAYWDDGITKEFYSSYGNASVGEIISYMLRHNLSLAMPHDMCLFWKDRETQLWRLWPLSKICEKAGQGPYEPGEWEVSHMFVQTKETDIDIKYYLPFSPQWRREAESLEIGVGKNYPGQFTYSDANASEADNQNAPLIIVGEDKRKIFYYDTTAIPQNVEDFININYTMKKYTQGPALSIPYNKAQKILDNKRIDRTMHPDPYGRRNDSLVHQVWNRIMQSGLLMATIKGDSHICAGKFIGFDSKTFQETKYDYRQFGTWFILESTMTLREDSLAVTCSCVKPEAFRSMELQNGIE